MDISIQIIGLIASLSILVFIHELGHYFFARLFKTRVEKFYLFFNPYFAIARMKKINGKWEFSFFSSNSPESWDEHPDNTEWGLGWLPLGGYCSIAGMIDETKSSDDLASEPQAWEYRSKPAWQRLLIIVGGVLMNFIFALVLYVTITFTWGKEYIPIENASHGFYFSEAAKEIGFETGDKIVSVGGNSPKELGDFVTTMLIDDPENVVVERNGEDVTISLTEDSWKGMLGKQFCQFNMPFVIDSAIVDYPAANANLQKGDSIIAVNDFYTNSYFEIVSLFDSLKGKEVTLSYVRNDSVYNQAVALTDEGKIGAFPKTGYLKTETERYGFFASIPVGIQQGVDFLGLYVKQFKRVFTKEGASQIGGFGAIGSLFPKDWNWQHFWANTALLSVILAFMNFLPIPALDGGYLLFILVEMITRRKPSDKFIGYANTVGFALLFLLLIYANGMDIFRAFF